MPAESARRALRCRLGSDLLDGCPDGVWLVDLAPLADQTLVASAVLSALQLPSATGSALRRRRRVPQDPPAPADPGQLRARDRSGSRRRGRYRAVVPLRAHVCRPAERRWTSPASRSIGCRRLRSPRFAAGVRKTRLPYDAVALFVDRALAVDAELCVDRRQRARMLQRSAAGWTAFRSRSSSPPRA